MLLGWVGTGLHFLTEAAECLHDQLRQVSVYFEEARRELFVQAQHIMGYQSLAIAVYT